MLADAITLSSTAAARVSIDPPARGTPTEPQRLAASGDVSAASALIRRDPTQIDAVLGAFAEVRPGLVPDLIAASADTIQRRPAAPAPAEEPSVGNRIWGGVRALGGGLEAVAGGALLLAPEPTMLSKAGGVVLGSNGIDNLQAGVRQAWTGRETDSLTQQGVEAGAGALGADPGTARALGIGVDIGIGFIGSGAAALSRLGAESRLVWNGIKATQEVHAGTAIPRSFELTAGSTRVWVHGNGTKHLAEFAGAMRARGLAPELVNLGSQVQLSSLQAAVRVAGREGIRFEQTMRIGGWELIFSRPRADMALPVLKHALPLR